MALVKVNGASMLRDTNSMALINNDPIGKNEYLVKARILQNQKTELNNMRSEMDSIKSDVLEIKLMLQKFMDITK